MTDRFVISPLKKCDVPLIAELEKVCFSDPWSEIAFSDALERGSPNFFTVYDNENGNIAGYIGVIYVLDEGQIINAAVSQEYRRRGIGRCMFDFIIESAKSKGILFLTLEVRESNRAARTLYEKFGFEYVGLRKKYYTKPVEDALLMTLNL